MSRVLSPAGALLLLVSAFSAFPSPFYASVLAASAWGVWAPASLFSAHGIAVIGAMTLLRRAPRLGSRPRVTLTLALGLDAVGGVLLAAGFGSSQLALLLIARVVTGMALGLATPVLTEILARDDAGTAVATAATLGGVGLGALVAGGLSAVGLTTDLVFLVGAGVLVASTALVRRLPSLGRGPAGTVLVAAATGPDLAVAVAALLVFAANGLLGLFTSLIPIALVDRVGGGALMAGAIVATVMVGAGLARLILSEPAGTRSMVVLLCALTLGAVVTVAGAHHSCTPAVLAGGAFLGAGAGIGYDSGMRMAIGSKVDALSRLGALARVQRAGQLGLVIPALAVPMFIRA